MTVEDDILRELKEQTLLMRHEISVLFDIKFELVNARIQTATNYTILLKKPNLWIRFRYWLRGKIKGQFFF